MPKQPSMRVKLHIKTHDGEALEHECECWRIHFGAEYISVEDIGGVRWSNVKEITIKTLP